MPRAGFEPAIQWDRLYFTYPLQDEYVSYMTCSLLGQYVSMSIHACFVLHAVVKVMLALVVSMVQGLVCLPLDLMVAGSNPAEPMSRAIGRAFKCNKNQQHTFVRMGSEARVTRFYGM
jgi:hypothetical protein